MLGNAAHDAAAEHALAGVAAELGFHQRCSHARQLDRFRTPKFRSVPAQLE
jgi:hypothetical protein